MTAVDGAALGHRLRQLMDERDLTVADLSRVSGLSERHLGDIVRGVTKAPRVRTVDQLAAALDVPREDLLGADARSEMFVTELTLDDADVLRAVALVNRQTAQQVLRAAVHEWASARRLDEPAIEGILSSARKARIDRARRAVEATDSDDAAGP